MVKSSLSIHVKSLFWWIKEAELQVKWSLLWSIRNERERERNFNFQFLYLWVKTNISIDL